ncbi:MAG TPA: hypothetical protein VH951_07750, partial [Dehalococcoidia bacterium]
MAQTGNKRVLICGAGIGGPTLAYWLSRYGWQPTLVEIAPALRQGGYMIDFWGVGYDVAERMELIPRLQQVGYQFEQLTLQNRHGRRIGGFDAGLLRKALNGRYLSILRTDLAREIYRTIDGKVETIFGESVTAIDQDETEVRVAFKHAPPRT